MVDKNIKNADVYIKLCHIEETMYILKRKCNIN